MKAETRMDHMKRDLAWCVIQEMARDSGYEPMEILKALTHPLVREEVATQCKFNAQNEGGEE